MFAFAPLCCPRMTSKVWEFLAKEAALIKISCFEMVRRNMWHHIPLYQQLRLWQSLFGAPQGHRWWQALRHENVSLAWLVTASVLKLWDWRLSKPYIQPQNIRDKAAGVVRILSVSPGILERSAPVVFPIVSHSPWFPMVPQAAEGARLEPLAAQAGRSRSRGH